MSRRKKRRKKKKRKEQKKRMDECAGMTFEGLPGTVLKNISIIRGLSHSSIKDND